MKGIDSVTAIKSRFSPLTTVELRFDKMQRIAMVERYMMTKIITAALISGRIETRDVEVRF
jgi:hypothetical protein